MTRSLAAMAWGVLGLLAGFLLWVVVLAVIGIGGVYPTVAMYAAFILAFVIWLVGAPIAYVRLRGRETADQRRRLVFLTGMGVFHIVTCLRVVILVCAR